MFKNLTIILIAYGEVLFLGGNVTSLELSSFIMMVLSSVVDTWANQRAVTTMVSSLGDLDEEILGSTTFDLNPGYLLILAVSLRRRLF